MSAVIKTDGKLRQLDKTAEPPDQVTEEQVQDSKRLSRLLMSMLRDVVTLKRRWWPTFIDFEDVTVDGTGTTKYRFAHRLGKRVRWWPVDWTGATAGPRLVRHTDSDDRTLVLVSYTAGTLTLRTEEAG
jgi:hypothetical protein